jgi:hypothetical protein
MKFKDIIGTLLTEATPDEIYKKYYSDIDPTTFYRIVSLDPKTQTSFDKILKIGKYAKVLLKLHREGQLKSEDYPKATEYLNYAYHHQIPIVDSTINSLGDLYNAIKHKIANANQPLNEILSLLGKEEYDLLHNGEHWLIFKPNNERASAYIGVNTQWCTTWGQYSLNPQYKDRTCHFGSHNRRGPLYIIINKSDESDKYQFHFESKQFMNPSDRQIDTASFLDKNLEIEQFFFPALYNENATIRQYDNAISNSFVLSSKKTNLLISKYIDVTIDKSEEQANELAQLIVNGASEWRQRIEDFSDVITDDSLDDIVITNAHVEFDIQNAGGDINRVEDLINSYERSKEYSYNNISENLYYDREYTHENLLELLGEYYEKERDLMIKWFGKPAKTKESFMTWYSNHILDSDKVFDKYKDVYADGTSTELENAYQAEIDDIQKYIIVDGYSNVKTVKVSKVYFLLFILKNKINKIGEGNQYEYIEDVVNQYIEEYSIPTDFDEEPEYNYIYPTLKDMEGIFSDVLGNLAPSEDDDEHNECLKKKKELQQILGEYFDKDFKFENEHVYIEIKKPWLENFDCEKGVEIEFKNKEKNTSYSGYVQVENLPKYITNYDLFESVLQIRKRL